MWAINLERGRVAVHYAEHAKDFARLLLALSRQPPGLIRKTLQFSQVRIPDLLHRYQVCKHTEARAGVNQGSYNCCHRHYPYSRW